MSESHAPDGRLQRRGYGTLEIGLLLTFVVAVLVAMAAVPVSMNRRIQAMDGEISGTLNPAARLASELQFAQARARSALHAFLLTGNRRFRLRYGDALEREDSVLASLTVLSQSMALSVRERMARLDDLSFTWHFGHRDVLDERVTREEFLEFLPRENEEYDQLLDVTSELLTSISREERTARQRMADARARAVVITWGLVVLALLATAVVWLLGVRLAQARRQAERRREDAVLARRSTDAVLAATGDGIFGLDLEGRCTFVNDAATSLLGYGSGELVGRRLHDVVHSQGPGGEALAWQDCPAFGVIESGDAVRGLPQHLTRRDGSTFPVLYSARPMVDGLETRGVVVTFADMTEARAQARALERAVQARDEVLAVVSHDLRNPVGSIYSAAGLLLDVPLSDERRQEHLRLIQGSARQATRLIQDLLDVARMEGGGFSVRTAPTDVADLVREAAETQASRATDGGIDLDVEVAPDVGEITADRARLLQVLSNLVDNALKFTEGGGRVRLAAKREGGVVVIEVQDRGRGMDAATLEHVFDRFWQAERSGRSGAGLGLAIVKGIVDAHGGDIEVESQPGEGTLFRVSLRPDGRAPEDPE